MFKQLVLFILLINSVSNFAMVYDEDKDGVFYLMGTLTCSGERIVKRIKKSTPSCVPLKYDDRDGIAVEKKSRSCSILFLLQQFIEQHEYSMPATPFGL